MKYEWPNFPLDQKDFNKQVTLVNQTQSMAIAKPATVVGKANQKPSGRKIIKSVKAANDTRKSIQ